MSWPSAVPHAPEAIDFLNSSGKQYFVLTNDASMTAATRAARYGESGLVIEPSRIISSGMLLTAYFARQDLHGARCVVLGTETAPLLLGMQVEWRFPVTPILTHW